LGSYPDCRAADSAILRRLLDQLFYPRTLVGWQIVHDDDIAFRERGNQVGFYPFFKEGGVRSEERRVGKECRSRGGAEH